MNNLNEYVQPKQLYVDGVKVSMLVKTNTLYTWLLCDDTYIRKVSTYDYDRREEFMLSIKDN